MSNNRVWILLAAVVSIGVLALGWVLGISPKLEEMNSANLERSSVDQQNLVKAQQLVVMKEQFTRIDELRKDLSKLQVSLPPGDDLSTFLGQLHDLEVASGVLLAQFSSSDPQKYLPAVGAVTDQLITGENFVIVPINLTVQGTREQVIKFVSDLQFGKRLFLVNQLTVAQDSTQTAGEEESPKYTGTLSGYAYVLIDPASPPPTFTPPGSLDSKNEPTPAPSP